MLKLHTPIELKNDPSIFTRNDGFAARLSANYEQIAAHLTPEDLLHLMSAPPEVYVAEGSTHSLVDLTNHFQSQEIRLNLVNNVLNRVLLAGEGLTYQDQVFVENVLRRIGVTDVKAFIQQVRLLQQETENRNELIDLYWENYETLSGLMERYERVREREPGEQKEPEEKKERERLWLHQRIFDRLQTGALYQQMRNYTSIRTGDKRFLTRQELGLAQQSVMAEHILLNRLKSSTAREELTLVYNHLNAYELGDGGEEDVKVRTPQRVPSALIEAVLLNAVDEIYAICYNGKKQKNLWYELANVVYEAAGDTLERFEAYHNRTRILENDRREYHTAVRERQQKEITAVKALLERQRDTGTLMKEMFEEKQTQLVYRTEGEVEDEQTPVVHEDGRAANENYLLRERERQETEHLKQVERLLHRERETAGEREVRVVHESTPPPQQTQEPQALRIDRERAMGDVLRAMEHPREVLLEYMNTETVVETQIREQRERLREVFDEETLRIFETLARYRRQPEELLERGMILQDPLGQLARDITAERLTREEEKLLVHEQTLREEERDVTDVRTHILRERAQETPVVSETHSSSERLALLHRVQETGIDEELLEELLRTSRQTNRETAERQELYNERNVVEQTVTNRVNERKLTDNEELEEILGRTVKQQLRGMSEQVYRKLEQRMDAERRRRGI